MSIHLRASNVYKDVDKIYVKVNGAYKECSQVYVKVDGVWKPCIFYIGNQTQWGINRGWNGLSNVQVGSTITMCFNAELWTVIYDRDSYMGGTVSRQSFHVRPSGATPAGSNVWLVNHSTSDGDLYYIDIDYRYKYWVTISYTATSTNPSFDLTWKDSPSGGSGGGWGSYMAGEEGFHIIDGRFEYSTIYVP